MRARAAACLLAAALAAGCAARRADPAVEVRRALAERLAARGDWGAAFEAADALVREDPADRRARLLRAQALRHGGALAEAEADLDRVLRADAGDAAAHGELALVCEETRRPEEALRHHREAARLDPESARAANNLGFALLARGRPAEAVPILEAALQRHPADARLRNNLGFAYAAGGDFTRAARQFALGGTPAQARHNLGVAYERGQNLERAYDLYLEAAKLDTGLHLPRTNLVHVARQLGRPLPPEAAGAGELTRGAP
ncbi:MAG TPA: tetratricopeptide repeat protein [Anaeromyxobacteraceae bacterium]|nr:tetratricopeptide repeat protein [Anaeromyxobacteraceae bacterium]